MAICVAIGEWRVEVERVVQVLGTSPGITTFNTQAEIVRVKTNQFREKVDGTEVAFLTSKRKSQAGRAALLERMKTELGTKIHAAIQKFVTSKTAAALDVVGLTGDMAPFVAQITQESTDFWTHITRVEIEYLEFLMHLQNGIGHAAVRRANNDVETDSPHVPPDVSNGTLSTAQPYAGSGHQSKCGKDRSRCSEKGASPRQHGKRETG